MVVAHKAAGPQNEEVKRRNRSGIETGHGLLLIKEIAGIVNAYLFGRISGRSL